MWTVGTIRDHLSVEREGDAVRMYVTEDGRTATYLMTPTEAEKLKEALS